MALLDIIDQLPATSRLHAAIVNNPEQAALIASTPEAQFPDDWKPRPEEWTLTNELLASLYDLLLAVNSDPDGRKPQRWPRPPNLVAELAREMVEQSRASYVDDLMNGRVRVDTE